MFYKYNTITNKYEGKVDDAKYNVMTGKLIEGYTEKEPPAIPAGKELFYESNKWVLKDIDYQAIFERAKQNKLFELKQTRDTLVSKIVVTLKSGECINGDEMSQTRLSRIIQSLSDTVKVNWIDTNNKTIQLTKSKLQEALTLATQKQTEIYVKYNELRVKVNSIKTANDLKSIIFN